MSGRKNQSDILNLKDINKNSVNTLKEHLKKIDSRLSLSSAISIAKSVTTLFLKESNVIRLKTPLVLFGDIHGQYSDLVNITDSLPTLCNTEPWLFLGDYVDRGHFGCEVVLFLFALKICYPNGIYLLRGNHECRQVTEYYDFKKECMAKYNSLELYEAIMKAFDALPLAALIEGGNNHNFLCLHGGLSPNIETIDDIERIDRVKEPHLDDGLSDILWSDPLPDSTGENLSKEVMEEWYAFAYDQNPNRRFGKIFGHTATIKFLQRNNLECIIRAHEFQVEGYFQHYMHSVQKRKFPIVLTLFTAPNYCKYGNIGCILRLSPPQKNINSNKHIDHDHESYHPKFTFTQFDESPIPPYVEPLKEPLQNHTDKTGSRVAGIISFFEGSDNIPEDRQRRMSIDKLRGIFKTKMQQYIDTIRG